MSDRQGLSPALADCLDSIRVTGKSVHVPAELHHVVDYRSLSDLLMMLGIGYCDSGRFDRALVAYTRQIHLLAAMALIHKDDPLFQARKQQHFAALSAAYFNRANTFDALGEYGDALADYARALELPNHKPWDVLGNRALVFEKLGRLDDAVRDLLAARNATWRRLPRVENALARCRAKMSGDGLVDKISLQLLAGFRGESTKGGREPRYENPPGRKARRFLALLAVNAVLGCLTGAMWFLLVEWAGVGYLVSGIILGLGWLLVAIARWMGRSRSDAVATSTKGGSYEWAASNTWTVLGVVEAGFLGGLVGYLGYTVIVPVVWLVGHFSESTRAEAAGMSLRRASFPRKYLAGIAREISSIVTNAIIIVLYVFIYSRWIVTDPGIAGMTTLKDYLVVTTSFFVWSALCVAALTSMRSRQP